MLPFVALLLFALMGIAALNVDMGLGFGSSAHMESLAETLALERARSGAGDIEGEEAELRILLDSMVTPPPAEGSPPPGIARPSFSLPIEGPALGAGGEVGLSRRIPLLFGMAAVPTRDAEGVEGLSLGRLREARASGNGMLESGGLRGRGLAPGARARTWERPVLRVGLPQVRPSGERVPGLADVALEWTAVAGLFALPESPPLRVDEESGELQLPGPEAAVVGHVLRHRDNHDEPCQGRACPGWRVGDPLRFREGVRPAVSGPAYVAVYRCDRVLGYVGAALELLNDRTVVVMRPSTSTRVAENASAVPDPSAPVAEGSDDEGGDCAFGLAEVRELAEAESLPLLRVAGLGRDESIPTEAP